ncbi:MAG TPA: TolC family protein, partial [Telluria sp.]|nr:TolC family protein [Telluria sp.]
MVRYDAPMSFCHRSLSAVCLAVLLGACASYVPLTLEERAPAAVADTAAIDLDRVAALALAGNPDLRLARADARLAHGQAYAAGLFADPQLSLSHDLSTSGGPDLVPAHSFGISYDLNALLLHSSNAGAAQADAVKADLSVRWQAWQARSQARLLFVKLVYGQQALDVLGENAELFADRVQRLQAALARGLVTADT